MATFGKWQVKESVGCKIQNRQSKMDLCVTHCDDEGDSDTPVVAEADGPLG